jgi:Protein of unknown function (DUF2786)
MSAAETDTDYLSVCIEAQRRLLELIAAVWSRGWQPAELARYFRRTADPTTADLAVLVISADHAARSHETIDQRWAEQLDALDLPVVDNASEWLVEWVQRDRGPWSHLDSSITMLELFLGVIQPLPVIVPPPGGTARHAATSRHVARSNDPMLNRVRALLAQAESTTFEAEAETFTAKAQELITRHAIDMAMLGGPTTGDEVNTIRIAIDDPYVTAKSMLLFGVARHSRCRAVLHRAYAMASIIGLEHDVAATEMLFTSLLVQLQTAMHTASARSPAGSHERSRGFRSAFVLAFAQRVEERLAEINAAIVADIEADIGHSLLPVLAARSAAVDAAVDEMFGKLGTLSSRRTVDGAGWVSGRMAADRAQLNAGNLAASRRGLSPGPR